MSRFFDTEFPRLVDLIYDAGLNPGLWQRFLDALPESFGDARGVLYTFEEQKGLSNFSYIFGADLSFLPSYVEHYAVLNPYIPAVLSLPLGKVTPATFCVDAGEVDRSAFFNEWMRPQGIAADHPGVLVEKKGQRGIVLGLSQKPSNFKRNRVSYFDRLQLLVPHVARALELNRTIATAEQTPAAPSTLEAFNAAAFVVNSSSRVITLNYLAAELVRSERVVSLGRNGELQAASRGFSSDLVSCIAAVTAGIRIALPPIRLTSQKSGLGFIVTIVSLRPKAAMQESLQREHLAADGYEPCALVLIAPADRRIAIGADIIASAFGLTPAGGKLVSALVACEALESYAGRMGLSRNTVRNQLAQVFHRTGTSRQAELISVVLGALAHVGRE